MQEDSIILQEAGRGPNRGVPRDAKLGADWPWNRRA